MKRLLPPLLTALSVIARPAALRAEKKAINPPEFAATGLPFSSAMLIDGTLYVSGQIGRDPKTLKVPADFEEEVKRCLDNIGITLKAAGMSFSDAVSVTVYLTDMSLFARMNAVYATYFKDPKPARTSAGVVRLAIPDARVEITVIAKK